MRLFFTNADIFSYCLFKFSGLPIKLCSQLNLRKMTIGLTIIRSRFVYKLSTLYMTRYDMLYYVNAELLSHR